MITLYSGTPGSGKSLHVTQVMLRCLKNRYVISNYPIRFTKKEKKRGFEDRFFYYPNEKITINNLVEFAIDHDFIEKQKESQCLVVIDEAGGRFNCRDFARKDRMEWIDFFSQHRKLGFDFILVAQNDRQIDRQIRGFIEYEKKHRKLNNFGFLMLIPFKTFVAVEYWYTIRQRIGSEFFIYTKNLGKRYDSMKMFAGFKLSSELLKKINNTKINKDSSLDVNINAIFNEESG